MTLMCQGDCPIEGPRSWLVVGRDSKISAERRGMLVKAALYAIQVFYSFFIMYEVQPFRLGPMLR